MHPGNGSMNAKNLMANDHENPAGLSSIEPQQASADADAKCDYDVGYRKPPTKSQFQKGKSGNPKGRAKASTISDVAPLIESILAEPVKVREGEQIRTVSNLHAILQAQLALALKGKPAAIRRIFELAKKASLFSRVPQKSFIELTEPGGEDGKILRAYHAENARQAAGNNKAPGTSRDGQP
jgi:hypothetical protein